MGAPGKRTDCAAVVMDDALVDRPMALVPRLDLPGFEGGIGEEGFEVTLA